MTSTLHIPAGYLTLGLDSTGAIVELIDSRSGRNYISPGKFVLLVRLVINGILVLPASVRWSAADNTLSFVNDTGIAFEVDVRVLQKNGYATFEVTRVKTDRDYDVQALLWGPLPVAINQTVGEAAGVVRDNEFAIGLKPLNDRTEGAWPKEYPQYGWGNDIISNPYNLYVASMEPWSVAAKTSWGAVLRAFTYDYTRRRDRLNPDGYPIPLGPLDRAGSVIGSKIALYGSAPELVTTLLSFIASGENLPYPTQNGQWQKVAQASGQSSFVVNDLDTGNVDKAARLAHSAGINYIYSPENYRGPWKSTGHYQFDSTFGGSDNGAEKLVKTAKEHGVRVGVHTMSDFISVGPPTSIDPYVSPPADPRLALGCQATLSRSLNMTTAMLYLSGFVPMPDGIKEKMLRIGDEFISYKDAQRSGSEWKVSGLTRGQWDSIPAPAARGTPVASVIVNSYNGAIGGLGIIDEIATRLGTIRNNVGIRYHSFDGVESASDTGWGSFGIARLINGTYAAQTGHDGYISETSRMTSNAWDMLTRANWTNLDMDQLYRNNVFYQANYLPGMLGWFDITDLSLTQIETRLARGAALNAGIGFRGWVATLPSAPKILDKIKQWETARNLGAFTEKQRAALRDQTTCWTLETITPGQSWSLRPVSSGGIPIGNPQTVSVPTPQLGPAVLPAAARGTLYAAKITSNTPATVRFTVTSGGLPPGLQFNQDTGGIVGTPGRTGSYTFGVTATNDGGLADARAVYTIVVN
ncbi:Ig domain-containing protein [Burkholderia cepacia]|nr:Ig domain-containing protein [Burkholderia cepacia]